MKPQIGLLNLLLFSPFSFATCDIVESIKGVNVRAEPNSSSAKVGYFSKGGQYALIQKSGNWYNYWYDGQPRWSYGKGYLEEKQGECTTLTKVQQVHAGLDDTSEVYGTAPSESKWVIQSHTPNWYEVWFANQRAYLKKQLDHIDINILSRSNEFAFVGTYYSYQPITSFNLNITWQLISAPTGHQLEGDTLFWQPTESDLGSHTIKWQGTASNGQIIAHDYTLTVLPATQANCQVVESIKGVNVRAHPNGSAQKIGYIRSKEQYSLIGENGNWKNLWFEGHQAWSYAKGYLTQGGGRCIAITQETPVNISAEIDSNQQALVQPDTRFVVLQEVDDWYQIRWQNQLGYIRKSHSQLLPVHDNWQFESTPSGKAYVGASFQYYPRLNNQQNVTFKLTQSPAGMTLNDGALVWKPTAQQVGKHTVQITAMDVSKSELKQSFDIEVSELDQASCAIVEGVKNVNVRASNSSASEKVGYLHATEQYALLGQNGNWANMWFDNEPRWAYAKGYLSQSQGICAEAIAQSDVYNANNVIIGNVPSGSVWVVVQQTNDYVETWFNGNIAKINKQHLRIETEQRQYVFTSTPDTQAYSKQQYSYELSVDSEGPVEFSLLNAPSGMSLSGNRITWTPPEATFGQFPVTVLATVDGQTIEQSYSIDVSALFPPCDT
ncbi:putative Ig domain-containing protein [Pseudoalteromonas sp. SMS1]|uniref:putative Ig domain-containing protein n=1 Tax=Pseudoalteromonas sp. SMS1 TaxID=2908894 RepID=UPI001F2D63CF|nr:putative Ig domain-containing protein [Pseudoalteromonas sp. SMS1]MCF2857262.1 putative Ig domain-containing protein [Pseudoalteromonas sp. SMS1]